MNHRSSSYTGRAPRTLQSAFGPYHTANFGREPRSEKAAGVILAIVIGISFALLLVHQLSK